MRAGQAKNAVNSEEQQMFLRHLTWISERRRLKKRKERKGETFQSEKKKNGNKRGAPEGGKRI